MAKKQQDDPPAGSPAWMATFSDLMNLLLCFFVLLFSMSTIDEAKLNQLIASMSSSFSVFSGGATSIGEGVLISNGISQLNELSQYINSMGLSADSSNESAKLEQNDQETTGVDSTANQDGEAGAESLEQMENAIAEANLADNEALAELIDEAVSESNMSDQIDVSFSAQYVLLTMKGALLFDSGSAQLKDKSYAVLDKVGVILERYGQGEIEINGHTDNVPISGGKYRDNEQLSSDRALSVFYYLIDNTNLDPIKLKHAGMGERIPIADNATPEGRSRNRRVEIRIYNSNQ